MPDAITVAGFTAPGGVSWVRVTRGDRVACLPLHEFHGSAKGAFNHLAQKGFIVIGVAATRLLLNQVAAIDDFPLTQCVEQIGWNGDHFALPDGTVFSPEGVTAGDVLFAPMPRRCAKRGTLRGWKRDVASPLAGQAIPVFALCFAYTGSILSLTKRAGNFGMELVGGKGIGKSTVQQLAASAIGGVCQGEDGHYWQTLDTTLNALEISMADHSDLPMILEEANLFLAGSSPRVRADNFTAIAFRLANGTEKARYGGAQPREFRFVYLTSSNDSLQTLIGTNSPSAAAARDRMMTIPIASSRPHGVFDSIPQKFASGGAFAAALISAADQHHGSSIRQFLAQLVKARARDEAALRRDIEGWVAEFQAKAKVDRNDGSASRVAEAFGLVYAAGKLAVGYQALPRKLGCGRAILACYRLHLNSGGAQQPFVDQLAAVMARDDIIDLGNRKLSSLPSNEYAEALGFVSTRMGHRELWIHPSKIESLLPNWSTLKRQPDVLAMLKREGRHLGVKRPAAAGGAPVRVHCFALP